MGARLQYMSKDEITEEKVQEAMRVSKNEQNQLIEGQTAEEIGMIRYIIRALTDKKLDLSKI